MSQTQQLIEQVRQKLDGATDYKIAKALDLPTGIMHYYVTGEREADTYACARIAEILDVDPLEVIAQVEAEAARTEKKRAYWRSLFSGLKRHAHAVALCVIAGGLTLGPPGGHAEAGPLVGSHNVYYVKCRKEHPMSLPQNSNPLGVLLVNCCGMLELSCDESGLGEIWGDLLIWPPARRKNGYQVESLVKTTGSGQ